MRACCCLAWGPPRGHFCTCKSTPRMVCGNLRVCLGQDPGIDWGKFAQIGPGRPRWIHQRIGIFDWPNVHKLSLQVNTGPPSSTPTTTTMPPNPHRRGREHRAQRTPALGRGSLSVGLFTGSAVVVLRCVVHVTTGHQRHGLGIHSVRLGHHWPPPLHDQLDPYAVRIV